ncbi:MULTISPECIES: hypothetical protein [Croceitalea]|uniref:Uncharacterized protein n=1 Tax=Croceitalea vernalis TaxID=3075599 RepID=A0ABU3BD27_9FLAO|nr:MULTISPECIES: hypothetical protein [unclassified Croceitalea]MDT0538594.1 hypothetical protein [Croceitalea sp. P059]MDT0620380.1 hypothetical protein [Croceitalea sp. P007]
MKRKLREELVKLSTDIITSREDSELTDLYEVAKNLYEKLAVLKFIDEKLNDVEVDVSKNVLAARFEKMAGAVMNENRAVPENSPHEEDIITPGMDTIKGMVSEMPTEALEYIFGDFMTKPLKNEKEEKEPEIAIEKEVTKNLSLNDKLNKELQIGLNDKLAFVKHLFNNNMEDYTRALSQLTTIDTEERSVAFINNMVKPEYNNWEGKDEYAERFMALIERKFA